MSGIKVTICVAQALLIVLAAIGPAAAGPFFGGRNPGFMCGGYGMFFMLGFFVLAAIGVFVGVRYFNLADRIKAVLNGGNNQPQDPLALLEARYVKGEISKEEFERIKGDLS